MKALNTIVKVLTALAAVAGVVYIIAAYGERIVAWCKKVLASCPVVYEVEDPEPVEEPVDAPAEEPAEGAEAPAEEAPVVEAPVEEPAAEVVVTENEPVAAEEDFAE